jgi:hypothetical protein
MRTKVRVAVDVVVEIPDGWAGPPVRTVALDVIRRLCAPLEDGRFDQGDSSAHVRSIAATVDGQTGWVVVPAGDEEGRESGQESGQRGQESGQRGQESGQEGRQEAPVPGDFWGGRSTMSRSAREKLPRFRGGMGRVSRNGYTIEVGAWKRDVDELRGESAPDMLGEAVGALDPPATAAEVAWLCRFVAGLGLTVDLCCATMGAILVATTRAEVAEGVAGGRDG